MLLPDIHRGVTWTPEHMRRCLARYAASLPRLSRMRFFESWERRHGRASAAALSAEAKAEFIAARRAQC